MNQEERLQASALKDIRQNLITLGKQSNPSEIIETIRIVESQIITFMDAVKGEAAKPKMMRRIVTFASNSGEGMSAYDEAETLANEWLDVHPDAEVLQSHTNMAASAEWSEYCITLVVRVPVEESEKQQ